VQTQRNIEGTTVVPRDVLEVAREAALSAGAQLIARYGRPPRGLGAKQGPTDLVSDADQAAEAAIAAVLARRRPDDGILGEEGTANREGTTGLRWVVDPLDGTVNYLSGIPLWCVSIACEDAMGTLAGVVHDPVREQTFAAVRGGPAHVDAPSTRERELDDLAAATIAGDIACATEEEAKRAARLEKRLFSRIGSRRMLGTAALELAWAAAGRLDVVYHEQRIHPWDVDAGLFICQRAGLRVHRLEPLEPELAPRYLAAPPDLAAEVLHLIGPSAKERRRAAERPPLSAQRVAEAMRRRRDED
jgi:myo-inositol-1(or 4)-monophosphatase